MVQARQQKQLPQHVLEFFEETIKFCPGYAAEFAREADIAAKGLKSPGRRRSRRSCSA